MRSAFPPYVIYETNFLVRDTSAPYSGSLQTRPWVPGFRHRSRATALPRADAWPPVSGAVVASRSELASVRRRPSPSALGKELQQPRARSWADAALGYQAGHEPRRRHIEGIVRRRTVGRREPDGDAPPILGPTFDMGDLAALALLDRDRSPALDLPVAGRPRPR